LAGPILRLGELIKYGRGYLAPREPVSLYRYVEHLVVLATKRKFGLESVLEIGPGSDPLLRFLDPEECRPAAIADYNPKVLDHCATVPPLQGIDAIHVDVAKDGATARLARPWDLVLASSMLEHLADDQAFVDLLHGVTREGGCAVATTVLGPRLYNLWDHAVGHYRRYRVDGLRELFGAFKEVQIIQSSLAQELVRPLFFGRVRHLEDNTVEQNNWIFSAEHADRGRPPYAAIFGLVRWGLPAYLLVDWALRGVQGGIAIVIARK